MRLRAITPLYCTLEEMARRQERYNRLAPAGVTITVANLPDFPGVPRSLGSRGEIIASEAFVYQEGMRTDPRAFDGIFVDCVLDPAADELAEDAPVAVFAPLRLTVSLMHGLGQRFAAVTRNDAIGQALRRKVLHYGLGASLDSVDALHLSFDEIARPEAWNRAMLGLVDSLESRGTVDALINGCSAVDLLPTGARRIRVIDPVETALRLIAVGIGTGLQAP